MGNFIYHHGDTTISEDKYNEFEERVKKIFWLGGSMNVSEVQIFDKTLHLIESPKPIINSYWNGTSNLLKAGFNYFEEDTWEPAGYDLNQHCVYSGKVGWAQHMATIFASYILQEIYSGEKCLTSPSGITYRTLAWLNFIFNENFRLPMRENFFHVYNILKSDKYSSLEDIFKYMPGGVCIYNESFYAMVDELTKTKNFDEIIVLLTECNKILDSAILDIFCDLLKKDEKFLLRYSQLFKNMTATQQIRRIFELYVSRRQNYASNSKKQQPPIISLKALSIRIFAVIVQKVYDIPIQDTLKIKEDFQDWKYTPLSLENDVGEEILQQYQNKGDMTTERFFCISPDDRLYWWDESFTLSSECKDMLKLFKKKYDSLLLVENDLVSEIDSLKKLIHVLSKHEEIFTGVPFFKSAFYEILDHLHDKRFRVLFKVIEVFEKDIVKVSELEKNNLKDKVKKYIAMIANPKLRLRVLGI